MNTRDFKALFKYDKNKEGFVGVEREAFILSKGSHLPQPRAYELYTLWQSKGIPSKVAGDHCFGPDSIMWEPAIPAEIGYELSACQIESRSGPVRLERLSDALHSTKRRLTDLALYCGGCHLGYTEVGPENMPLDVYPDPTERYQKITRDMPQDVLSAACRVIGTHIHIGMRDHESALHTYNHVIRHINELCEKGNSSFGERLAIYRHMAPDYEPMSYASWDAYYHYAVEKGFVDDPRKCWTLIRMSVHGTIEFRMFGSTESDARIVSWAERCHELCMMAMAEYC